MGMYYIIRSKDISSNGIVASLKEQLPDNDTFDAMTAHTAVVFTRYMMLSLESRESNDNRSLGELFLYFSDEMSDITWIQAFQMLLQMFRTMLTENTELSDEKISELVDAFINALPIMLKTQLQAT